jgi:hypothetical protein
MHAWSARCEAALDVEACPLVCRLVEVDGWLDIFHANSKQWKILADVMWHLHDVND